MLLSVLFLPLIVNQIKMRFICLNISKSQNGSVAVQANLFSANRFYLSPSSPIYVAFEYFLILLFFTTRRHRWFVSSPVEYVRFRSMVSAIIFIYLSRFFSQVLRWQTGRWEFRTFFMIHICQLNPFLILNRPWNGHHRYFCLYTHTSNVFNHTGQWLSWAVSNCHSIYSVSYKTQLRDRLGARP